MNMFNTQEAFDAPIQTKHHFGYMSGVMQQIGSFDYGQHVVVDKLNQPGRTFELSAEDYADMVEAYRDLPIKPDQWLFIDVEADEQDFVMSWKLMMLPYSLEYATQLMQSSYYRNHLIEVFGFIQQLDSVALQSFMWSLFNQRDLARKFVSIPASRQHHHAYPGGLLEHSVECMRMVKAALDQLPHLSKREKDLTQIATLLHDIGKTQTLRVSGDHTLEGFNINHEHYTLSVMADELRQLKKTYEQAAVALEYMLTWKISDGYPKFIGANLVKAADRVSTGAQLREQAFAQIPSHYHFTQIQAGSSSVQLSRLN